MANYKLADEVSASGDGDSNTIPNADGIRSGILQVDISDSASVQLQGRILESMGWANVGDVIAASGAVSVALFPYMRVTYSIDTGTVTAVLMG